MNGIKRVTDNESEPPIHKKARFNSTPISDNEDRDSNGGIDIDTNLEDFRKEAIWREMEEYRRKYERAQKTITSLERERNKCEARLSAVDLSWNQLVQQADLLLPSTSTASNGHSHSALSPAVSDPNLTDDELEEALALRSTATKALLGRLSSLHTTEEASTTKVDELQQTCRELIEQSQRSQESLRLLRTQHDTTLEQLEATCTELTRAEKRFDRSKSNSLARIEGRVLPSVLSDLERTKAMSMESRASSNANSPRGSPPPGPSSLGFHHFAESGDNSQLVRKLEELESLLKSRTESLEELRNDRVTLKMDLDGLKGKLVELPDDLVANSVLFRLLQTHVGYLAVDSEARKSELSKAQEEANMLREMQESFREKVFSEAAEQVDDIQKRLLAKEADLTRVRSQREDYRGEATELRAKESEKVRNLDQLKTLASSREDRIVAYSSEVRRLKMQIAASKGDLATVDLLGNSEEVDVITELQNRLKMTEDFILGLRDQIRSYTSNSGTYNASTIAESETEARKELSTCRDRLVKLESLLGPEGKVEVKELVEKLQMKEEEMKVFEAQLKSQDHATNMLYEEIDRLSAAWTALDEQNNSKVFNLVHLEEKVQRLTTEKAKSDVRYFNTMRLKDASTTENAVLTKLAEKQQRMVTSAEDLRHSLGVQLTAAEKEISFQQKSLQLNKETILAMKREQLEVQMRSKQHSDHINELNSQLADRISQAESEIAQRKRVEEQCAKLTREHQRSAKLLAASSSSYSSGGGNESAEIKELKEHNDDLSKMLKCSTCTLRFKEVIINRCGHLFCKECIEDRLSNRQRKCPSCGIAFGKDDVSNVYF